jgi:anhydro-N-acetylmuramic acid kinase
MRKNKSLNSYRVIGIMSGTSCDGVDVAYCRFTLRNGKWHFTLVKAYTFSYPAQWLNRLQHAHLLPADELLVLHADYGRWLGALVNRFCKKEKLPRPHAVASHGHTVFHQPRRQFTFQLGSGYALYASCGIPVVCDFRALDVALGGEGAPLVPAGDALLFAEYDVCLNLGGIANLSYSYRGKRLAFDVCFTNMALNYLSGQAGQAYDKGGRMAQAGEVHIRLLRSLQAIYDKLLENRQSLSREIFAAHLQPVLDRSDISVADKLATCTEVIAHSIVKALPAKRNLSVLCTGGGAFNHYLMYRLLHHGGDRVQFIIPEAEVVKYKEALIFAFLGVLRLRDEVNTLCSVTGALHDSSGGVLIGPFKT